MKSNLPPADIVINGRVYQMWQQFVHRAHEWVGGKLEDLGDNVDRALGVGGSSSVTKIVDIQLTPNGTDSACFEVKGAAFSCAGDVKYLGVVAGEDGWITLEGFGGHTFRFKQPEKGSA